MSDHRLSAETEPSEGAASSAVVNHPTRGADRNRHAQTADTHASEQTLLPSLDPGLTLLDIDGERGVPAVHALVLDHLLLSDGPAFWVDARGYATTTTFARLSPSRRLLERIHVARGFTPYQHYAAITDLPGAVARQSDRTEASHTTHHSDAGQPSLIVTPALDARYRDTGTSLARENAETLQARALAALSRYAHDYDIPALVTRTRTDQFTAPIETAAAHTIHCEQTRLGPRFRGDGFETTMYPVADGAYHQTTFAYWQRILAARADELGVDPVPTSASDSSRTAFDGQSANASSPASHEGSLTVTPLYDAWQNGGVSNLVGE